MSAEDSNPDLHAIKDGRFVCRATQEASCRNYPACECEEWSAELHGPERAPGHEDVPQDECWMEPWINASDLEDSYIDDALEAMYEDEDERLTWPDGPVETEWEGDFLGWTYAAATSPAVVPDDDAAGGAL